MPLSGHTRELSLPDLLQLQGMSRSNCRVELRGPAGPGRLVLAGGEVVDAEYGGLRGEDAAYALMAEDDLHYEVRRDVTVEPSRRSMELGAQELIMEAARRRDEGQLVPPRPPRLSAPATLRPVVRDDEGEGAPGPGSVRTPSLEGPAAAARTRAEGEGRPAREAPQTSGTAPASESAPASVAAPPGGSATRKAAPAARPSTGSRSAGSRRSGPSPAVLLGIAASLMILLVALGGWFLTREGDLPGSAGAEEAPAAAAELDGAERDPVDAAELTGPRDAPPERLTGGDPRSPDPQAPLQPTVVLRLHVDSEGRVVEAEVYRSRPGLDAFEAEALEAVQGWRFAPGRREGVAVPTVINWPVEFQAGGQP